MFGPPLRGACPEGSHVENGLATAGRPPLTVSISGVFSVSSLVQQVRVLRQNRARSDCFLSAGNKLTAGSTRFRDTPLHENSIYFTGESRDSVDLLPESGRGVGEPPDPVIHLLPENRRRDAWATGPNIFRSSRRPRTTYGRPEFRTRSCTLAIDANNFGRRFCAVVRIFVAGN